MPRIPARCEEHDVSGKAMGREKAIRAACWTARKKPQLLTSGTATVPLTGAQTIERTLRNPISFAASVGDTLVGASMTLTLAWGRCAQAEARQTRTEMCGFSESSS